MGNGLKGETDRVSESPEEQEKQKYRAVREAMDEERRIMAEMDDIFASTPDRAEAERIIVERWASFMDEAVRNTGEAVRDWLDFVREAGESEREE